MAETLESLIARTPATVSPMQIPPFDVALLDFDACRGHRISATVQHPAAEPDNLTASLFYLAGNADQIIVDVVETHPPVG